MWDPRLFDRTFVVESYAIRQGLPTWDTQTRLTREVGWHFRSQGHQRDTETRSQQTLPGFFLGGHAAGRVAKSPPLANSQISSEMVQTGSRLVVTGKQILGWPKKSARQKQFALVEALRSHINHAVCKSGTAGVLLNNTGWTSVMTRRTDCTSKGVSRICIPSSTSESVTSPRQTTAYGSEVSRSRAARHLRGSTPVFRGESVYWAQLNSDDLVDVHNAFWSVNDMKIVQKGEESYRWQRTAGYNLHNAVLAEKVQRKHQEIILLATLRRGAMCIFPQEIKTASKELPREWQHSTTSCDAQRCVTRGLSLPHHRLTAPWPTGPCL